jgi:hypothetical protein
MWRRYTRTMKSDATAARYESTIREWANLTRHQSKANIAKANRIFEEIQALYLRLRETSEGRLAIEGLARDPEGLVRLTAATHCLTWNLALGRSILEEIANGGAPAGPGWDMAGTNAKWTLKTLEAGKLNLDWQPKAHPAEPRAG